MKDYENAVKYVEELMKFLKKNISNLLHKKGRFKKFITTKEYRDYGYEWEKDGHVINLSMRFETPTSRFINLILVFTKHDFY